jgi:glycosyltransferase involved in cell wall biosynthesis
MKILLVTDGRYPEYVNGVSIYIHYLAQEMVKNGQEIYIFHHIKSGFLKRPKIIQTRKNGIMYYGLDNSPVAFSEALIHPQRNCREKKIEGIFTDLLKQINPDIVHFHEFHRTPSYCIDICKEQNIPAIVTLHDYWFICPRLQLLTLDEYICEGPDKGKNCAVNCLAGDSFTRQYRKMITMLPDGHLLKGIKKLRNIYKKIKGRHLGQASSLPGEKKKLADKKDNRLIDSFRLRETGVKKSLLKADRILAVSTSVKETFEKHGINHNKITVNQLGVKSVDWTEKKVRHFTQYPIRFGFLGHLGPLKGAQLVLDAVKTISPEKAEFLFFGGGSDEALYDFKKSTKDLVNCKYMGRYDYGSIDDIFDCFDILIIPSICMETLGMTGLEAQAAGIPVIASDIGGMKDYIRHGINGVLFPPGDVNALTGCINRILENPSQIGKMSDQAINPRTISEDYGTVMSIYEDLIKNKKDQIQDPGKNKRNKSCLPFVPEAAISCGSR